MRRLLFLRHEHSLLGKLNSGIVRMIAVTGILAFKEERQSHFMCLDLVKLVLYTLTGMCTASSSEVALLFQYVLGEQD